MKCILLCAGYATRLFPLTENFPKHLLEVGNKKIIDYTIEKLNEVDAVDEIYIVTNNKYYDHFIKWSKSVITNKKIVVINDGTYSNDDRLGAVGDIRFCVKKMGIDDDLMIICADNLYEYSLNEFYNFYREKKSPVVVGQYIENQDDLKRFGVAEIDSSNRIIGLIEKPEIPKTNLAVWGTYIYPRETLHLIDKYFDEGNKADSPGNLIMYVYKKTSSYLYVIDVPCYDVGTHESLEEVNKIYSKKCEK